MGKKEAFAFAFALGVATGLLVSIAVMEFTDNRFYRQGQIDTLTGKIHYELITHDDSTRTWERIE